MINNSLLKQNNEKSKNLSIEINKLTNQKKDFITECFINLAKFDFRKQFLQWFKDNKLDQTTEVGQEKAKEVIEGIEQTDQMTNSLINFITNGDPKALENFDKEKKSKKSKTKGGKKDNV